MNKVGLAIALSGGLLLTWGIVAYLDDKSGNLICEDDSNFTINDECTTLRFPFIRLVAGEVMLVVGIIILWTNPRLGRKTLSSNTESRTKSGSEEG